MNLRLVRPLALAAVFVTSALAFTGCNPGFPRADFVFLNGAEPESLDSSVITGQPDGRIVNALFEGLTRFDSHGRAVPGVAERWDISEDGRVYTFHLRPDARWSNGDPVTANDFVGSWKRVLTPETAAPYSSQLYPIQNAQAFNEGSLKDFSQVGVRALSPRTLEVTLTHPTAFFIDLCAFPTLSPVHLPTVEKYGDAWVKPQHIVTNGAYTLKAWRVNDRIRLEKSPMYWGHDRVQMQVIDALPTSSANTAFNLYATGMADLILDKGLVPNQILDELKKRPDFHSAPYLATYFLRFNCTKPPFNDPRVRRALSMVIDREVLVDKITRAGEPPAQSMVPPGTGGAYQSPPGLGYNVEKARALLAEAGFPGGKGFPRFEYLYNFSEANEAIAIEIQGMFQRELGITMELKREEWKSYLASMSNLRYDLSRGSWIGDYNDPNTFLSIFTTNDGNNRTGWGNPEFDRFIAAAAAERDPAKRFEHFRAAEAILVSSDAPVSPLYFFVGIQFYDRERLGGMEANLLDEHPLSALYWKDRPKP